MKALRRTCLILLALVVLVGAAAAWLVGTASGARVALKLARSRLPGSLVVGRVEGSLVGPLILRDVEYFGPAGAPGVKLAKVEVDIVASELVRGRLHVVRASAEGVRATLSVPKEKKLSASPLFLPPLQLPALPPRWPVRVDAFTATDIRVERGGEVLLELNTIEAAGHWHATELQVARLEFSGPQGAGDLQARLAVGTSPRLEAEGKIRWVIQGKVYAGKLGSRTEGDQMLVEADLASPFLASVRAELIPADVPRWTLVLEVPELDPRGVFAPAASALTRVGMQLRAEGEAGRAKIAGTVGLNGDSITIEGLQAALAPDSLHIESLLARINDAPGTIRADGQLRFAAGSPEYDLNLALEQLVFPASWTRQEMQASGSFRARGDSTRYAAEGSLAVGPVGRPSQLEFSVRGDRARMQLDPLRVRQRGGRLEARGEVSFQPLRWDVTADAENFDPGEFVAGWTGRLGGELHSRGGIESDGPHVDVRISRLAGQLKGRTIVGEGQLAYTPAGWVQGDIHVEAGDARARIRSSPGVSPETHVDVAVPDLAAWIPGVAGGLRADVVVRGKWPDIGVTGEASGQNLSFGNLRAGHVDLAADLANVRRPAGRLRANLRQVAAGRFEFAHLRIEGAGNDAAHEFNMQAEGQPMRAGLKLTGTMAAERWSGVVQELQFRWAELPELVLLAPALVSADRSGAFSLARAQLAGGALRLAVAGSRSAAKEWAAELDLDQLPLSFVDDLAPGALPVRLEGQVIAQAKIRRVGTQPWTGEARLSSPSARAVPRETNGTRDAAPPDLMVYEDLEIVAAFEDQHGRAKVTATLAGNGRLEAELGFSDLGTTDAGVSGTVDATLPTLEPLALFVPQVPGLEGRVEANLQLGGKLRAPEIAGRVEASALKAELPRLGLRLHGGTLRVEPGGGRELKIAGAIRSGDGQAELAGTWTPEGAGRATLKGERFLAADLPAARVIVAPDLTIDYRPTGLSLNGKARITEAAINLQQLPQGRASGRSRDVVVVDRPEETPRRGMVPLDAEVTVELGEKVHVTGFGLEAELGGRVTVMEKAGAPTSASGEILVTGTYQGYGQDLKITRGRVLYAGTPLNDPRLDLSAERELEEITAGVRITGTAQAPEVNVFSQPDMGQADALSYLVTGKPLSGVASQGESDRLDSAARSLGTAAGTLVAERIGRRLGIDEIGIEDSDMIDGGVFTIGQYLSPRLYVAYGVGLFEPGDLVTLRYELTKALNLRAVRGPDETRAGVEYKVER